ncbi:MAG TPA: ribose 5-phosphate isomerase B [Erysipelotrichaceae bacterium]|nr:ribose 5-phosphate isomerase B [Erysipelotrichaceae bacterium]HCW56225.1 ribose 5-phosphate isomerase B [Erysipelotrichaceae bacterium]
MKVGIANDHSAIEMKKELIPYLESEGYEIVNFGTDTTDAVDYPDYGEKLANAVAAHEVDLGIAICGTGVGISLSCNKVAGIRACCCSEPYSAKYSRLHNNANIICFGARVIGVETAKMILDNFLPVPFEGDTPEGARHLRRVNKIMDIEKRNQEKQ